MDPEKLKRLVEVGSELERRNALTPRQSEILVELRKRSALSEPSQAEAPKQEELSPLQRGFDVAKRAATIAAAPFLPNQAIAAERQAAQAVGAGGAAIAGQIERGQKDIESLPLKAQAALVPITTAGTVGKFILPKSELEAQALMLQGPIGDVAGTAVGKTAEYLSPKLSVSAKSLIALAEKNGVYLSPADISKSEIISGLETALERTPFGGDVIARGRKKSLDALIALKSSIQSRLGGKAALEAGQIAQDAAKSLSQAAAGRETQAYNILENVIPGNTKIPFKNTQARAAELLNQELAAKPALQDKGLISVLSDLAGKKKPLPTGEVLGGQATGLGEAIAEKDATLAADMGDMSFQGWRANRSRLNSLIAQEDGAIAATHMPGQKFQSSRAGGVYKQLKASLDKDLEAFSASTGGDVKDAFDTATALARQNRLDYANKAVIRLTSKNPDVIVNTFFKPNNITEIRQIKKAVGDKAFENLSKAWMEKIFQRFQPLESGRPIALADFQRMATGMDKELAKYGSQFLQEVLPKGSVGELMDLSRLASNVGVAEKIASQGPSSRGIASAMSYGSAGAALTQGPMGWLSAAGILGTPKVLAELYVSPIGRRMLIQGFRIPAGTPAAASHAAKISAYLASKGIKDNGLPRNR